MFDECSVHAKRVIFLSRLGAGRRGAEMIEVDDLLVALLLEDQNNMSEALGETGEASAVISLEAPQPFLSADLAAGLLEELQALPRSHPIPDSTDMSISAELERHWRSRVSCASSSRVRRLRPCISWRCSWPARTAD